MEPTVRVKHNDIILNKIVSLKVSLFAWRSLRNQIPTKDNLVRHGIISFKFQCVLVANEWRRSYVFGM